jgi:myo-inositol-1(or 4)-monophosphatase
MTEKHWKDFILELTARMRQRVLQFLGRPGSRSISGKSIGGDSTFLIDDISETFLSRYLENSNLDIAYYSEERGLVKYGSPEKLLIVDTIDGTRAAAAGLESSCISIALSTFTEDPRIRDLELGCVQEIKSGRIFIAEKDKGPEIIYKGKTYYPSLSKNTDIGSLFWSIGLRGRPVVPIIEILEELIDSSNFNGSVFYLGSASFSITRVVSGQLDCYIDIGHRLVSDFPVLEKNYTKVGQGSIINNYPYDIAAGYIILRESGGCITDASGKSLEERPLMGIGRDFQLSIVASSNEELHSILLMMIERGFNKLEDNLGRY